MNQWATETKVRAERRCGELLRDASETSVHLSTGLEVLHQERSGAPLREGVVVDYRAVDIARAKRRLNADSMSRFTIASLISRGLMRLRYLGERADSRIG